LYFAMKSSNLLAVHPLQRLLQQVGVVPAPSMA